MAKNLEHAPEVIARAIADRDARLRAAKVQSLASGTEAPEAKESVYEADDLVLEAGENAGPEAHVAAERFRSLRADEVRQETVSERDAEMRVAPWAPASVLPTIPPRDGWHFRWVRLSSRGEADDLNVNQSFREGFVPATAEDIGNIHLSSDKSVRFPGAIEVGGLLLCKIPEERRLAREEYYNRQSISQITGVNNDILRENDPRMPLLRPSANSRTTFGVGRGQV